MCPLNHSEYHCMIFFPTQDEQVSDRFCIKSKIFLGEFPVILQMPFRMVGRRRG